MAVPVSGMKGEKTKSTRSIGTLMTIDATLRISSLKNHRTAPPHRCQGGIPSCNHCAKTTSTTLSLVSSVFSHGPVQILSTIVRRASRASFSLNRYSTMNVGRFRKICHKMRIPVRMMAKRHPSVKTKGFISFSLLVSPARPDTGRTPQQEG